MAPRKPTTRHIALARLVERIVDNGKTAKVYGRQADGSITVESWAPGDQMPYWRGRVSLEGGVVDDNAWRD